MNIARVCRMIFLFALLLLTLGVFALLRYGDALLVTLLDRYLASQALELQREELQLDWLAGSVSARQLVLLSRPDGQVLVTAARLHGQVKLLDLWQADNGQSSLKLSQVAVYLAPQQTSSEGSRLGGGWLVYRNWLPGHIAVEELAVHRPGEQAEPPTVLVQLHGETGQQSDSYELRARVLHAGNHLTANATLLDITHLGDDLYGLDLKLALGLSNDQGAGQLHFAGQLREEVHGLRYQGSIGGEVENTSWLLQQSGIDVPVNGALEALARIDGDLDGFQLNELNLLIDNTPEFSLSGSGVLGYAFTGEDSLDLVVNADLLDIQRLEELIEVDLGQLGAAQVSLRLQGQFDDLKLSDIRLRTKNESGIEIDLEGEIHISNFSADRLLEDNGLSVQVKGPGLAELRRWTGDLGFETGPWQASVTLLQIEDRLRVGDIQVSTDDGAGLQLRAQGFIEDAGNIRTGEFSSINGIELEVELVSAFSKRLTQLFAPELGELGAVSARAQVQGNNTLLHIDGLVATLQREGSYRASAHDGTLDLHLGNGSPLRNVHMQLGADIYASPTEKAVVGKLEGDLSIGGIGPLQELELNLQLREVSTSRLLQLTRSEFSHSGQSGYLNGKVTLAGSSEGFRLQHIDIRNMGNPQVQFTVSGAVNNLEDFSAIDLRAEGVVSDRALLRELTGIALSPWRGKLHITAPKEDVELVSRNTFGNTDVNAHLFLDFEASSLVALDGEISSPVFYPRDLGLSMSGGAVPVGGAAESGGAQKNAVASVGDEAMARALHNLPRMQMDLQFKLGKFLGDNFQGERVQADFAAAGGLYTLRRLELNHGGGRTRLQGSLDMRGEPAAWKLKGTVLDLPAEELLLDLGISSDITGSFNTAVDLNATGYSGEALIASLGGSVTLVLEDTTVKGAAYDVLATETVAWFFSGAALEEETVFSCMMGAFELERGRARTDELFVATDRMLAEGTAEFDFNQMMVNVEITPRSRERAIQIPGKITISGPMNDLQLSSPALAAASNATAEAVTIAPRFAIRVYDATIGTFVGEKKKEKEISPCKQVAVP